MILKIARFFILSLLILACSNTKVQPTAHSEVPPNNSPLPQSQQITPPQQPGHDSTQNQAIVLPVSLLIQPDPQDPKLVKLIVEFHTPIASQSLLKIKLGPNTQLLRGQNTELLPPQLNPGQLERILLLSGPNPSFNVQLSIQDNGMFIEMHETYPQNPEPYSNTTIPSIPAPEGTTDAGIPVTQTSPVHKK